MALASSGRLRTAFLLAAGLVVAGTSAALYDVPAVSPTLSGGVTAASAAATDDRVTTLTGPRSPFDPLGLVAPAAIPAGSASIRPGAVTETAGAGLCTSSFVFTSGEKILLGQAAHCGGTGADTETDGCTSATVPTGTPVTVRGTGGDVTATMVYSSWVTMQQRGEQDPDACAYNDLALVELPPDAGARTNPSVPFFGGPRGVHDGGLAPGTAVFGLGNPEGPAESSAGGTGVGTAGRTLRPRVGTGGEDVGGGWGHTVYTTPQGVPGESGAPLLDGSGRAVGLLSSLNVGGERESIEYTDLARAMDYARSNGGLPDLTLAAGTEPFTPAPAGVAPTDLAPPAGPPIAAGG
ncbi:serine protease [Pseudonocardia sp. KRD291]|uniref:serine protease n=1 Tax=Pseudonocardia sp. KRD291 TaxID=2792007 RepID=UPI001C4A59E0|nr:serine protease [Pseudonocardia sp. KRD291]MBW0102831.1 serine protease [Pseudonocardia sp. KRD291]